MHRDMPLVHTVVQQLAALVSKHILFAILMGCWIFTIICIGEPYSRIRLTTWNKTPR